MSVSVCLCRMTHQKGLIFYLLSLFAFFRSFLMDWFRCRVCQISQSSFFPVWLSCNCQLNSISITMLLKWPWTLNIFQENWNVFSCTELVSSIEKMCIADRLSRFILKIQKILLVYDLELYTLLQKVLCAGLFGEMA